MTASQKEEMASQSPSLRLQTSDSSSQASPMEVVDRLPPHGTDDRRVFGAREENLSPSSF
uniref:SFRICE_008521 n=1 Tax=Spodoptera frugiperda TaxID=7108 RepID=A0A2H1V6U8_SPOFR